MENTGGRGSRGRVFHGEMRLFDCFDLFLISFLFSPIVVVIVVAALNVSYGCGWLGLRLPS